jgi:5-methylthioadenosine/S-adenosylhomocysteine deaminase
MTSSIVRSKSMITGIVGKNEWSAIEDGAVLAKDGAIAEVGTYADLSKRHPNLPVHGSGNEILVPGFVNAHHHIGLTPVQLGGADMPLELWGLTRMPARSVDPYLDTLYSAFEMIESGTTTVQHINGHASIGGKGTQANFEAAIRAYQDIGMRASFCYNIRDQNHIVYGDDDAFLATLPDDLRPWMTEGAKRRKMPLDDYLDIFKSLYERYNGTARLAIQLAPFNLHGLSDKALGKIADVQERYQVPMHMHLVEGPYQKEYAYKRAGVSAYEVITRFGMTGPKMTLGHGTWLNAEDVEKIAEHGTCVCHNCSSNFRLRSGLMPLNHMEKLGVTTAIGIDEAGINEDRDMLSEMRLVLRAHRVPGHGDDDVPSMGQVFRMATRGGAATTPFGDTIGELKVGARADLSLFDWHQISHPFLDELTPVLDALIQRAKIAGVKMVMCDGEVIYKDGKFTRLDRDAILQEIAEHMGRPMTEGELETRRRVKQLSPHIRKFYDGYLPS